MSHHVDAILLFDLINAEDALQDLKIDVQSIDLSHLLCHWPRDEKGRLQLRTNVILNAYGLSTRKRQPVLIIFSGTKQKEAHQLKLSLSMEFLYNHRYQWKDARHLWTHAKSPTVSSAIKKAQQLLQQGLIEDACDLFNVKLHDSVRMFVVGVSMNRFAVINKQCQDLVVEALCMLAPWKLREGLERVEHYLSLANKRHSAVGSWERKLFWFPHQTQQVKQGLGVRFNHDKDPEIFIIKTASNEYFPDSDWLDRY